MITIDWKGDALYQESRPVSELYATIAYGEMCFWDVWQCDVLGRSLKIQQH